MPTTLYALLMRKTLCVHGTNAVVGYNREAVCKEDEMKLKHRRKQSSAVYMPSQGSSYSCSNVSEKLIREVNCSVVSSISIVLRLASSASQLSGTSIISPLLFLRSFVLSFFVDDGSGNSIAASIVVIASLRLCLCSRISTSIVRFAMT